MVKLNLKYLMLVLLITVFLVTTVSATNTSTIQFSFNVISEDTGGGGGGLPPTTPTTTTTSTIGAVYSDIVSFVLENPDYNTDDLQALADTINAEYGTELTVAEIASIISSLGPVSVSVGTVGGGGLPTEDSSKMCDLGITPDEVVINADNVAKEVRIFNYENESIPLTFGLYPLKDKKSAVEFITLRGDVSSVLPQDSKYIVVAGNPNFINSNNGTFYANLRIIIEGCKDVEVPIKIVTGGGFSFLAPGLSFGERIVEFFKFFGNLLNKQMVKIGSFSFRYWQLFILLNFALLGIMYLVPQFSSIILRNKIIISVLSCGFITILLSLLLKGG